MAKVSIIVPIYNAGKYLQRSIESLINQTLKDIEIILVNDGSTDDSLEVCERYSSTDKRIKIIDKPNSGVSSARNIGLQNATGEYIGFMDPDDWLDYNMYESMYKKAKQLQGDVVMCNYMTHSKETHDIIKIPIQKGILDKEEIITQIIPDMLAPKNLSNTSQTIMGSVWRLLVSRELVSNHKLIFPIDINLMEDLVFCISTLLKTDKLIIEESAYYHYMNNESSALGAYRDNMYEVHTRVYNYICDILKEEKVYNKMTDRMKTRAINTILASIVNEVHPNSPKAIGMRIKKIHQICDSNNIENATIKKCTLHKKLVLLAIKYKRSIFLYIYYTFIVRTRIRK